MGHSGFFDADLKFKDPFVDFGQTALDFLDQNLAPERVQTRLGTNLAHQLKAVIRENGHILIDVKPSTRLVHSDFNPKNIIVAQRDGHWSVASVLDWEFAFAASPLVDIGNFLRYEDEIPPAMREAFVAGYSDGTSLPENWRQSSLLMDLLAMLDFLTREDEFPRTFATAKRVIERTIERFSLKDPTGAI